VLPALAQGERTPCLARHGNVRTVHPGIGRSSIVARILGGGFFRQGRVRSRESQVRAGCHVWRRIPGRGMKKWRGGGHLPSPPTSFPHPRPLSHRNERGVGGEGSLRWQLRGTRRIGSRANAVAARPLTGTPTAACAAVGVRPVRSGGLRRIAPSDPGTELPPIARPRSDRVLAAPGFMPAVETRPATLPPLARPRLPLALPRTSGGSRESSVCRSSPISAWLPDLSGRLSACADPVASVRTLYIIVPDCQ
jgi:hypothetical protein